MTASIEARVTHRFRASAERVYDAWLDPGKAQLWMEAALVKLGLAGDTQRFEIDARVGGKFFFSDMREGTEARHWGTYLELDRPRKIAFTWITEESQEAEPSKVALTIEPDGEGCMATIVHELRSEWAEYVSRVESGWGAMLTAVDESLVG